ncbi:MAG: GspH/FimT family pseudopilin [Pseudomonadales bacterium]
MQPARPAPSGFTIVELMVSLAVAAILIGFALPAFNDFVDQRRMASRINDLVLAINYARSEAARRGGPVSVQALAPAADNEWGGGYCVVEGDPGNCGGVVLRRFEPYDDATLDAVPNRTTLTFNARGMLANGGAGTFELCSTDNSIDPGRVVNITFTGRPDVEELTCFP